MLQKYTISKCSSCPDTVLSWHWNLGKIILLLLLRHQDISGKHQDRVISNKNSHWDLSWMRLWECSWWQSAYILLLYLDVLTDKVIHSYPWLSPNHRYSKWHPIMSSHRALNTPHIACTPFRGPWPMRNNLTLKYQKYVCITKYKW